MCSVNKTELTFTYFFLVRFPGTVYVQYIFAYKSTNRETFLENVCFWLKMTVSNNTQFNTREITRSLTRGNHMNVNSTIELSFVQTFLVRFPGTVYVQDIFASKSTNRETFSKVYVSGWSTDFVVYNKCGLSNSFYVIANVYFTENPTVHYTSRRRSIHLWTGARVTQSIICKTITFGLK